MALKPFFLFLIVIFLFELHLKKILFDLLKFDTEKYFCWQNTDFLSGFLHFPERRKQLALPLQSGLREIALGPTDRHLSPGNEQARHHLFDCSSCGSRHPSVPGRNPITLSLTSFSLLVAALACRALWCADAKAGGGTAHGRVGALW